MTRREFVGGAAALAAGARPADGITAAFIGVGGRGSGLLSNFKNAAGAGPILTLCDVDEKLLAQRAASVKQKWGDAPATVTDYRRVLDDKNVQTVFIASPEHWHAIQAIHACQAGKDVYVEKPDAHNIVEGQRMVTAARKHKRMMQVGTQLRSAPFLRDAAEYIASGAIGKVVFGRAWETDGKRVIPKVPDSDPPAGVDYDRWLGPAPMRPFNRMRFHGNWRWFFDTGTGDLGNDGVHRMDYCRLLMGITELPRTISCMGGKLVVPDDAQEWPDHQIVTFDFGGRIILYEMRIGSQPALYGETEGAAVYGEKGWVLADNSSWKAYDIDGKLVKEGGDGKADVAHVENFLRCVGSRKHEELAQDIASGHISSVMCHAGNIAWRTGKTLKLDPATERFNDPEADQYLSRTYRKGYELPDV